VSWPLPRRPIQIGQARTDSAGSQRGKAAVGPAQLAPQRPGQEESARSIFFFLEMHLYFEYSANFEIE
jgi:hypothetical protein